MSFSIYSKQQGAPFYTVLHWWWTMIEGDIHSGRNKDDRQSVHPQLWPTVSCCVYHCWLWVSSAALSLFKHIEPLTDMQSTVCSFCHLLWHIVHLYKQFTRRVSDQVYSDVKVCDNFVLLTSLQCSQEHRTGHFLSHSNRTYVLVSVSTGFVVCAEERVTEGARQWVFVELAKAWVESRVRCDWHWVDKTVSSNITDKLLCPHLLTKIFLLFLLSGCGWLQGPVEQKSCAIPPFVLSCPPLSPCVPLCVSDPTPPPGPDSIPSVVSPLQPQAPLSPHAWDKASSLPAQWLPGSSCLSACLPSPSQEYG